MIEIEKTGNTLTFHLIDTVTAEDVNALKSAVQTSFEDADEIGLVADLIRWSDVTGDAIEADMGLELKLLGKLGRIGRIAFVADKAWVRAMVNAVGPWMPGTTLRVFAAGEVGEAVKWADG
ncbi:STAS/SEC14 domain-containing protein [Maritimibacter sp. UBA3975]|uniref:STAS/SEC14 domain-containing protein n=1 Tax=Maritimibacter sp. UBA3975 TaxID=1946833 RepID=UPI0025C19621|nr:STAS/SEC14 domain-containing protein [Maritimibacter sp. UBA3975]|tara:strand:- start:9252 stop:9614 length:363 start_codon:yes stop_codon:yes gene_type:complete